MKHYNRNFGNSDQTDNDEQTAHILNIVSDTLHQSGIRQFDRDDSSGIISFAIGTLAAVSIRANLPGECLKLFCYPGRPSKLINDPAYTEIMIQQKHYKILKQGSRLSCLLIPFPDGNAWSVICGALPLKRNLSRNLVHCLYEMNRLLLR